MQLISPVTASAVFATLKDPNNCPIATATALSVWNDSKTGVNMATSSLSVVYQNKYEQMVAICGNKYEKDRITCDWPGETKYEGTSQVRFALTLATTLTWTLLKCITIGIGTHRILTPTSAPFPPQKVSRWRCYRGATSWRRWPRSTYQNIITWTWHVNMYDTRTENLPKRPKSLFGTLRSMSLCIFVPTSGF